MEASIYALLANQKTYTKTKESKAKRGNAEEGGGRERDRESVERALSLVVIIASEQPVHCFLCVFCFVSFFPIFSFAALIYLHLAGAPLLMNGFGLTDRLLPRVKPTFFVFVFIPYLLSIIVLASRANPCCHPHTLKHLDWV